MTDWDGWEDRQHREIEAEAVDEWVTQQAKVVHAAAGLDGPWGTLHPVAWSYCTGRITAGSVPEWRQRYDANPSAVAQNLALCVAALGPQGPQSIQAAAGVYVPGGITVPVVAASPARSGGSRNAVEEIRANNPGLIEAATAGGPPPSMFAEGELPRATASGIDPVALARLPWRALLVAAWEPDRAAAFRMTQDFGDEDGDYTSRMELDRHPVVKGYVARVEQWARTSGVAVPEPLSVEEVTALYPPGTLGGDEA